MWCVWYVWYHGMYGMYEVIHPSIHPSIIQDLHPSSHHEEWGPHIHSYASSPASFQVCAKYVPMCSSQRMPHQTNLLHPRAKYQHRWLSLSCWHQNLSRPPFHLSVFSHHPFVSFFILRWKNHIKAEIMSVKTVSLKPFTDQKPGT